MFYNILKAKDIVELENDKEAGKYEREVLMQNEDSSLSIVAIKKDEIVDTHTAEADAAVYVIEGEIEIHFDAEKFKIEKGEILMFKKDKVHTVRALKDSKYFIVKI